MIEIIQVINDQFPNRIQSIHRSVFSRTAGYYSDEPNIIFSDKTTIKDPEWVEENNINAFPTTLFYKDGELIATRQGILASQHIIEVIEPYIPKFAIKK